MTAQNTQNTTQTAAPKTAPKKRTNANAKTYSVSQMAAALASKKGIDTTRAAKLVRSKLRGNFADVRATCKSVAKAKDAANDGNRWPTDMDAAVYAFVVNNDAAKRARLAISSLLLQIATVVPGDAP